MPDEEPTPARPSWRKRVLAWGLALAALSFVATMVPVRDKCVDPIAAATGTTSKARVGVSRDADGCTLYRPTGEARMAPEGCAALDCEPGLVSTFGRVRLPLVLALLVLYFSGTLAWSSRWHALLSFAGVDATRRDLWRITLEAQAGGIMLPGGVAGDALRVGFVVSRGARLAIVVASVLLDRVLGVATLTGGAAILAAIYGGKELAPMVLILGAIPIGSAIGLVLLRWPTFSRLPLFVGEGRIAKIARPVLDYLGNPAAPRAIAAALVFSVYNSFVQFACMRGLIAALGATPNGEPWVHLGTALSFVISAVPLLPGGWGTTDAAMIFFYGKAGIVASVALAAGLLYRLFWYGSGGVGALLYVLRPAAGAAKAGAERKA